MKIKVSVIIPAKDRELLLKRAISSVIKLDTSNIVEIIVVDDGSINPIPKFDFMRSWDRVIRLNENRGGGFARNEGIRKSLGDFIYFLDSDDMFLDMNFERDINMAEKNKIYYTNIKKGNSIKIFPSSISLNNFFNYIFNLHAGIAQTSSLMFLKENNIFFDESLPKHQDWDLILFSCLLKGITPTRKEGLVFVDWQDTNSVSRIKLPNRSNPWLNKIKENLNLNYHDYLYIELMCKDRIDQIEFLKLVFLSFCFFIERKISFKKFLGIVYRNSFLGN